MIAVCFIIIDERAVVRKRDGLAGTCDPYSFSSDRRGITDPVIFGGVTDIFSLRGKGEAVCRIFRYKCGFIRRGIPNEQSAVVDIGNRAAVAGNTEISGAAKEGVKTASEAIVNLSTGVSDTVDAIKLDVSEFRDYFHIAAEIIKIIIHAFSSKK